jgi:L-amino acid N-acyltransferase YncA
MRKIQKVLGMKSDRSFIIRGYRDSDRPAVRRLCCQTGFLGEPIDPVYQDHELFADFLTTYYTDHEPESSFVLEVDGEIRGYLLGSRKPLRNQLYAFQQNVVLFLRALARYPRYNQRSRQFIRWMISHGWREVPAAPRRVPHFHINLLPDARNMATTRGLMSAYLSYLYRCGEKRVYGQIVTFESRRGEKMFERYGFRVVNRAEITKYKAYYPESVYLSTVVKNLETAEPLSAYSRPRD